jgi:hypothetical protein
MRRLLRVIRLVGWNSTVLRQIPPDQHGASPYAAGPPDAPPPARAFFVCT